MKCINCSWEIYLSKANINKKQGEYIHTSTGSAYCKRGGTLAVPEGAMEHPHIIEKRRLEGLIAANLPPPNDPESAKTRLIALNGIIALAVAIQRSNPTLCYMTSCDLIRELL